MELGDRVTISRAVARYRPETSELTFTNIFIWREHYRTRWCLLGEWMLVLLDDGTAPPFALPPVGPPDRTAVVRRLLAWMRTEDGTAHPSIGRADARLVAELRAAGAAGPLETGGASTGVRGSADVPIEPEREHFDYVYRTDDLARLPGSGFETKRQHIAQFRRTWDLVYEPLTDAHIDDCLRVLDVWCEWRRCDEDQSLAGDREATREALTHHRELGLTGGVVHGDAGVEAFALGELLNDQTAVVHVEKADPHHPGLFAVINQQFARQAWPTTPYLNREQDLGEPGLRQSKLSYHPIRLVEKYRIRPWGESRR